MTLREKQLQGIADELDSIRRRWDHLLPAEQALAIARAKMLTDLSQKLIDRRLADKSLPDW